MTPWDELRKAAVGQANSILGSRADTVELRELFVEWIRATRNIPKSTLAEISVHPATTALADALQAAGLDDASDYVRSSFEEVGPIHSGEWLFAILLGRACASDLASALSAGEWRDVPFWGHEEFGAWDAFLSELVCILEHDEAAREGAWVILAEMINRATGDPRFTFGNSEERAGVRAHVAQYVANPTIQEAWEGPLESRVLLDRSFLFGIVRKLDAKRFLAEAEKIPHPMFLDPGLKDDADETEIAHLIAEAPLAFNSDGVFRHAGMIVVRLIREAAARIRHLAGSGRVYPLPLTPDDEARMRALTETATAAADVVLDAVFSRSDATFLAWAWLERLIFEGEHRGFWRSDPRQGAGKVVDALIVLIAALARRLDIRDDAQAWALATEGVRRSDRVAAVLSVAMFGRAPDCRTIEGLLRSTLINIEPPYSAQAAVVRSDSVMGRIGGQCILTVERPDAFVAKVWQHLRPFRERAWRSMLQGDEKTNLGELLVLWSIFALDEAPADVQPGLLRTIEAILSDAFQTDRHAPGGGFWPAALERFGRSFGKACLGIMADETVGRVANLVRPYLRADDYFFRLIVSLTVSGLDPAIVHRAVSSFGLHLPDLVGEFLATRQQPIARGDYPPQWLQRVRSLSVAGAQPNAAV